jgi:hypothetical protein
MKKTMNTTQLFTLTLPGLCHIGEAQSGQDVEGARLPAGR